MAEQITKAETVKKWYVVRAISGQEKKIKHQMEVEINRTGLSSFVSPKNPITPWTFFITCGTSPTNAASNKIYPP